MSQAVSPPPAACPRCARPLTDAGGLGWCPQCGYCRSLEQAPAPSPEAAAAAPPSQARQALGRTGAALGGVLAWAWLALAGAALLAAGAFLADRYVPLKPLERALWTTAQIAAGLGLMFAGQLLGLLKVAPEDVTLTFKDALVPLRLYGLVVKRLPMTRWSVYLACWGLTLIVSAAVFLGGLGHWYTYLPGHQNRAPAPYQPGPFHN